MICSKIFYCVVWVPLQTYNVTWIIYYPNYSFKNNIFFLFQWIMSSKKRSLDLYLAEVFKQFISIKDDDFKKSQNVFKSVFDQVKQKMGEQCNYFKKYASQVNTFHNVFIFTTYVSLFHNYRAESNLTHIVYRFVTAK